MRFASTPRGARLARRFAVARLDAWGFPHDGETAGTFGLLVGELAANAVVHGRVPGRDFVLRLALSGSRACARLRAEVTDSRTGGHPPPRPAAPSASAESGRGLFLVDALADRWGVGGRVPGPAPGKTVWAELDVRWGRGPCGRPYGR